jgi:hypothetical protein
MKLNNRLTGRRIGAAAVVAAVITWGGLAFAPAASAAPTVASAAPTVASATTLSTAHSVTHSTAVRPRTADACIQWLNFVDYPVGTARAIACQVAALGLPNPATAILLCTAALVVTGVDHANAFFACSLGSVPG